VEIIEDVKRVASRLDDEDLREMIVIEEVEVRDEGADVVRDLLVRPRVVDHHLPVVGLVKADLKVEIIEGVKIERTTRVEVIDVIRTVAAEVDVMIEAIEGEMDVMTIETEVESGDDLLNIQIECCFRRRTLAKI
jgi:hypothetical protein